MQVRTEMPSADRTARRRARSIDAGSRRSGERRRSPLWPMRPPPRARSRTHGNGMLLASGPSDLRKDIRDADELEYQPDDEHDAEHAEEAAGRQLLETL